MKTISVFLIAVFFVVPSVSTMKDMPMIHVPDNHIAAVEFHVDNTCIGFRRFCTVIGGEPDEDANDDEED
jgi:hypothetical protein